jgi:hypothetical protein
MKKLLTGLAVLPVLTGITLAAGPGGGSGGGSGGGNLPPPSPPSPIVVFKTEGVDISEASLYPNFVPCTGLPCQGAVVHTGPLPTGLDGQGFALDYFVTAKTIIANTNAHNTDQQLSATLGTCQLYANVFGKLVNLDFANVTVPASNYFPQPGRGQGFSLVTGDGGQTVVLEGALCPDVPVVRDIGVVCLGSPHTNVYNTILKVTPFSTANSPINNMSPASEQASPHSACSPAKFGTLGPG